MYTNGNYITHQNYFLVAPLFPNPGLHVVCLGTKWCGPGNVAKNYSDLGVYQREDICCREHDHCTRTLETGQCFFNLCNTSPYTRYVPRRPRRYRQKFKYIYSNLIDIDPCCSD